MAKVSNHRDTDRCTAIDRNYLAVLQTQGEIAEQMVRDELQFDFKHGNIMEHVGLLSHKITEGFQEVAATLRLNAVFDKELGTDEGESFFQTPDEYDGSRCALAQHFKLPLPGMLSDFVAPRRKKHVATQLESEVGELASQFGWALHES